VWIGERRADGRGSKEGYDLSWERARGEEKRRYGVW